MSEFSGSKWSIGVAASIDHLLPENINSYEIAAYFETLTTIVRFDKAFQPSDHNGQKTYIYPAR